MGKIQCDSCGQSLRNNGVVDSEKGFEYCRNCCMTNGQLKPYEEIKSDKVQFYIDFYNYPRTAAEGLVVRELKEMPAWSKREKW